MSENSAVDDRCRLCGTVLSTADAEQFCSDGCRNIHTVYGDPPADHSVNARPDTDSVTPADETQTRTFFRVDGMQAATCEAFLETTATDHDGVTAAAASYVTETVRVDHDPEVISKADLRDALSCVGYTAYLRDEAATDESAGSTHREREMSGLRKRRSEDMLEMRYVVGVVFGVFMLLPYATLLYPFYLNEFVDSRLLALYAAEFGTANALFYLQVFIVMTALIIYATGRPLCRSAYISLKLRRPTTGLLAMGTVAGAYGYSIIAVLVGHRYVYFDLAIVVAAIVMAGIFHETTIKRRTLDRLTDLTISQVEEARREHPDGTTETVPVETLTEGDRVLVTQGERIPVDGVAVDSSFTVDEAVITGESLPRSKADGDPVVGGSVVTTDAAIVQVGSETTSSIDQLTQAVWNLQSTDHGVQRRADELAAKAMPAVAAAVVLVTVGGLLTGRSLPIVGLLALGTVMVTAPWALGFAARFSIATSLEEALEHGIVVFDETVFERLRAIDTVVFDKTGTLTTGSMTVLDTTAPEALLPAVGVLEQRASHPAGEAIAAAFVDPDADAADAHHTDGGIENETPHVSDFRSYATGVGGTVDGRQVLAGHPDLFDEQGWTREDEIDDRVQAARAEGRLPVVVGRDGTAEGVIVVGDEPRADWAETMTGLAALDIVVLTGDDRAAAERFEQHGAVDHVFTGISPEGKAAAIERLTADRQVAMVGDGTNDAPALAAADLGISLGSGTALASDAADLAIVDETLTAVERAFALAAETRTRLEQSLRLALSYHVIVVPAALLGVLNPLVAIVAVAICALLVVANASRQLLE